MTIAGGADGSTRQRASHVHHEDVNAVEKIAKLPGLVGIPALAASNLPADVRSFAPAAPPLEMTHAKEADSQVALVSFR